MLLSTGGMISRFVSISGIQMCCIFWIFWTAEEAENVDKVLVAVAAAVPCGCFLIVLSVFIILRRVRKLQAENNAAAKQQQQREEIYENSLEIRRQEQASRLKHSTH
ncbi:uncharacterized protein LOC121650378 isoform X4 [Melanotaenia boesemani]|uniref:uncharacterized protein LOC121650378 isoform X4 n=1 Tax=Melanotaenia boesemani TaxID=1250792 RepID=UPI001C055A70|nr:uncharacterized protein LOC121650378 isoform X4 [Melanotaenia boesemani]